MKITFILLLLILTSNSLFAQKIYLKDKSTNESIPYAHIAFSNNGKGTHSNEEGCFELKDNVDSLYITHISFRDTVISTENLPNVLYLNQSENQLKSIDIRSSKKSKNNRDSFTPERDSKSHFNVTSFEIGTTFLKKEYKNWNFIKEVRIPITLGKDFPILRINIYKYDIEKKIPYLPIWSALVREKDYKKNEIILEGLFLDIKNEDNLFVSLDLISHDVNETNLSIDIPPYSNYKDALEVWIRKRKGSYCLIRNKRAKSDWIPFFVLSLQHSEKEPIIHLEIE